MVRMKERTSAMRRMVEIRLIISPRSLTGAG